MICIIRFKEGKSSGYWGGGGVNCQENSWQGPQGWKLGTGSQMTQETSSLRSEIQTGVEQGTPKLTSLLRKTICTSTKYYVKKYYLELKTYYFDVLI